MTDYTQLRKRATEALHWVPICDELDCSCREAWKNYADAANPQAVIELLDENARLKKDAYRYRFLVSWRFEDMTPEQRYTYDRLPADKAVIDAELDAAMVK